MKDTLKDFYEEYWVYRKGIGKIHAEDRAYIPERLKAVVSMIAYGDRKINILGGGAGTLRKLLKGKVKDIHVVGCDKSEKAVELARPYYDKVFQIDIDEDDLNKKTGEDKFDYIVCVEIIEHLLHPEVALNKCKKLLSKHGHLIVSFPNINIAWWKYRIKLLKGHFPEESRLYHHAEHLHDFTCIHS